MKVISTVARHVILYSQSDMTVDVVAVVVVVVAGVE